MHPSISRLHLTLGAVASCFFISLSIQLLTVKAAWALDTERILEFHSDIVVHPDASMSVTETIKIYAQGYEIKRGIIRDFPTVYEDAEGNRITVWFELDEVRRNGVPEQYLVSQKTNGVSIRIGNPEYYLPSGEHTYTIMYRTSRQLGFFLAFDELYWNVTGTGWSFPIDQASAVVTLPDGITADQIRVHAYTGAYGTRGQEYITEVSDNRAEFSATTALGRYEGLTIVVQWPKGFVTEPTPVEEARYWLQENLTLIVSALGILLVLAYFGIAWLRVGIDPQGGFIVPESEPPRGLSPAAVRYITRMSSDFKAFTAALISLGAQGLLRIETEDEVSYTLTKLADPPEGLLKEESALMASLFKDEDTVVISQDNRATLVRAQEALRKSLAQQFKGVYFLRNTRESGIGLALSALVAAVVVAAIFVPHAIVRPLVLFFVFAALVAINIVFKLLMPAYTNLGRMMLDRIQGFKLALSGGVDDLGDEHFGSKILVEQNLPYAVALEVQNQWAQRFEQAQKASSMTTGSTRTSYLPSWYTSSLARESSKYNNFGSFSSRFTSSFNSSISSASTPPGSSSGSSGGFSGGGGGGGGGSGW